MRKAAIFSFVLLLSLGLKAQIDSVFLRNLVDSARANYTIDRDVSRGFATQILTECERGDYPEIHAFALNWIGIIYMQQYSLDTANIYFDKAIAYSTKNSLIKEVSKAKFNKSLNILREQKYEEAAISGLVALQGFKDANDTIGVALAQFHIGSCYFKLAQLEIAETYFLASLKVTEERMSEVKLANVLGALGAVHAKLGKDKLAIEEFRKSIALKTSIGGEIYCGNQYVGIASIYSKQQESDSAKLYYSKALLASSTLGDLHLEMNTLVEYSLFFTTIEQFDSSLIYARKSLILYPLVADDYLRQMAYQRLSYAFEYTDKLDSALFYNQRYHHLKDSLESVDIKKRIADLDEKYQSAEKDQKILESQVLVQQQEIKNQNQILVIVFLSVLLIAFLIWFFIRKNRQRMEANLAMINERNRIALDLHDHVGAELTLVSSRLYAKVFNPNLKDSEKEDLEKIGTQIRQVNSTLRETVWSIQNESISTLQLQEKLEDVVFSLFEGRELNFDASVKCDMELNPQQALTFFRICQEGITNIYKYSDATQINWSIGCDNRILTIVLSDNGVGFDVANSATGYGLQNMKLRSQKLGASCSIKSKIGEGTTITIVQNLA